MVAADTMERHRIDIWLKLVCLFKHRTEATEACKGGKIKLNGQSVKPAASVKLGDVIEFYQGERLRKVVVEALPQTNVSKEVARTMYRDESPAPPPKEAFLASGTRDRGMGRPTKKERREIEKWRR